MSPPRRRPTGIKFHPRSSEEVSVRNALIFIVGINIDFLMWFSYKSTIEVLFFTPFSLVCKKNMTTWIFWLKRIKSLDLNTRVLSCLSKVLYNDIDRRPSALFTQLLAVLF